MELSSDCMFETVHCSQVRSYSHTHPGSLSVSQCCTLHLLSLWEKLRYSGDKVTKKHRSVLIWDLWLFRSSLSFSSEPHHTSQFMKIPANNPYRSPLRPHEKKSFSIARHLHHKHAIIIIVITHCGPVVQELALPSVTIFYRSKTSCFIFRNQNK